MLNAATLKVGDRIRQQVTNEEGIVEAIHLDANGRIERVTVAVNMAREGMKSGYPSMWDRIEPDPLPWNDDNPGQRDLASLVDAVTQAREALADEREGDYRAAVDVIAQRALAIQHFVQEM